MDECVKFRHFCKEDENNARRNQKNLRKMTLTDKEKLEAIQQILDEISSKQRNYLDDTSLLDYFERQIKKILEK